jgi:hypothetical protein
MRTREQYLQWSGAICATSATSLWWVLWITTAAMIALLVAVLVQVVGVVLVAWDAPKRHTGLAIAIGVVFPAIGPLAALAATVQGRGGRELLHDPHAKARPTNGQEIARSLAGAPPTLEAVVSTDPDMRRTVLANLSRRATSADIEILRWARARCGGDVALEVALAFDEASERFEHRAAVARAAVEQERSYVAAAHAFRILVEGIQSGIVDPPGIARLAAEARKYHDAAVAADSERARELLVARARLELTDHQPAAALEVLEQANLSDPNPELNALYKQAAFAARRFDLALTFTVPSGSKVLAG